MCVVGYYGASQNRPCQLYASPIMSELSRIPGKVNLTQTNNSTDRFSCDGKIY